MKSSSEIRSLQGGMQKNDRLLTILRELYAAANPTILDDADTGVRLSPEWNERLKQALQALNENNGNS